MRCATTSPSTTRRFRTSPLAWKRSLCARADSDSGYSRVRAAASLPGPPPAALRSSCSCAASAARHLPCPWLLAANPSPLFALTDFNERRGAITQQLGGRSFYGTCSCASSTLAKRLAEPCTRPSCLVQVYCHCTQTGEVFSLI